MRRSFMLVLAAALAAPMAGAHHTPPDASSVNVGIANCFKIPTAPTGTFSNPFLGGVIRVTDNGVLTITASLANQQPSSDPTSLPCTLRLSFTGVYDLQGTPGLEEGGLENIGAAGTCVADPSKTCEAKTQTGWWVTFLNEQRRKVTWGIDVYYRAEVLQASLVTGTFTGHVTVYEPSVPELALPDLVDVDRGV